MKVFSEASLFLLTCFFCLSQFSTVYAQTTDQNTQFDLSETTQTTQTASESSRSAIQTIPTPENPINLTLSPISLTLQTKPGEQANSAIRIFNNNIETEYLTIELAKFTADESGSEPIILPFEAGDVESEWVSFSEQNFSVNPGEWKTIQVSFNPPQSAELSYYYALLVKRQKSANIEEGSTAIAGAPAILMLTTVTSPNTIRELQLLDFSIKNKFVEYLPAEFTLDIKNTGNVHIRPIGNIFIDSMQNKDVGIIPVNQNSGLILPNTNRTYTTFWDDGFPAYKPVIENGTVKKDAEGNTIYKLEWDLANIKNLRIGKYTANLLLVYDNGERDIPIESVLTFWVIPWKILLVLLLAITLMGVGIILPVIFIIKRIKNKKKTTNVNQESDKQENEDKTTAQNQATS